MIKRLVIFILAFFVCSPLCAFAQKKDVLVIESYHADFIWDMSYIEGIKSVLGDQYNVVSFQMDTKRFPPAEFEKRAELAWEEYKKINPALVILGDDNALRFLGPKFVNTDTPVVYLGINANPRAYNMVGHKNITGVLERPLIKRSIVQLEKIFQPNLQKVLVLFDPGESSRAAVANFLESDFAEDQTAFSISLSGITVDIKIIGKFDVWQETVLNAKKDGYDVIILGTHHSIVDNQDKHVETADVVKWTSKNTPVPPFCLWDLSIGPDKAIGGLVIFGKEQGELAGQIALDILSGGKSPGDISPQIATRGHFLFCKSQLEKWGLKLPDDIAAEASFFAE